MRVHRPHMLKLLTQFTSIKKIKWFKIEQTDFENMISVMSRYLLLSYSKFNKTFDTHIDDIHSQLGK